MTPEERAAEVRKSRLLIEEAGSQLKMAERASNAPGFINRAIEKLAEAQARLERAAR